MSTSLLGTVLQTCRSSDKQPSDVGLTSCCVQDLQVGCVDVNVLRRRGATTGAVM